MSIELLGKEYLKYLNGTIREYENWMNEAKVKDEGEKHTDFDMWLTMRADTMSFRDKFKEVLKKYKE